MPMFDYKGEDARDMFAEIYAISAYGSASAYAPQFALRASGLENTTPPPGWRNISPSELGLGGDRLDLLGNYKGETPLIPNILAGQARVLGKFDDQGNLLKTAISFAGTSNATDAIEFPAMLNGSYIDQFDYLLDALAGYVGDNGLEGSDVYVTGYSLGAGATNNMHAKKDTAWDGFYADSQYLGVAVPVISEGDDILNFGFENDVVHRVAGNGSYNQVVQSVFTGNDKQYDNSTDNVVLFDDLYALPTWPNGIFSLADLSDWYAHFGGVFVNPVEVIGSSAFYEVIEQDSAVIIANLSEFSRANTWVEDKRTMTSDHYQDPSFVLGTAKADKIGDGPSDDFLQGFGGNDTFRVGRGFDTVHGGDGLDVVEMNGGPGGYHFIRLEDGTIFAQAKSGFQGVDEFIEVERAKFAGLNLLGIKLFQSTVSFLEDGLKMGGKTLSYADHEEGTAGDDMMTGNGGVDRLFGLEGDDTIEAGANHDLLHGGAGNDTLFGGAGMDILMGGFGDDVLYGGTQNDTLDGGTGSDIFDFTDAVFHHDTIIDFDVHQNGKDVLRFSSTDFADADAVIAAAHQSGAHTVINVGPDTVTLEFFKLAELTPDDIVIV